MSVAYVVARGVTALASTSVSHARVLQVTYPQPPTDHALVYVAGADNALAPLPFETGTTPLHVDVEAKNNKRSYVEIRGERAGEVITNGLPHFYLFVADEANVKLPFIVRLTGKNGARRVVVMAQKGYKGFAVDSEAIIKPNYRVLSRAGGAQFMEVTPREPLMMGEYAIMGADLTRIATFRIAEAASR